MFQLLLFLGLGYLALKPPKVKKDTLVITDDPEVAKGLKGGGMISQSNLDIDLTEGQDVETYSAETNEEWGGTDDIGGAGNRVFDDGKDDDSGLGGGGSVPVDRPETSGIKDVDVSYISELGKDQSSTISKYQSDKGTPKNYPSWDSKGASATATRGKTKAPPTKKFTGFDGVEDENDYSYSDFDGIND
jgi:hypothetical protein